MRSVLIAVPGAALAMSLLAAVPVQAAEPAADGDVAVTNATLAWNVSECAFDPAVFACTSLNERHELTGDVTRGADAWVFTGGDGTVDGDTGAMTVAWDASVLMGNTTRGNYTITLADPVMTVDAEGNGAISADVTWQIGTDTPAQTPGVTIVQFSGAGTSADFDVTPAQFDQAFLNALNPQLQGWFTPTGGAADAAKVPGPVAFDRWVPTIHVTLPQRFVDSGKNPRVSDRRFMVKVTGTGFDPAVAQNPAVQGLYVVFGPNPATTEGGYQNIGMYYRARYLPVAPDAQGQFMTQLQVKGRYTAAGMSFNGRFGDPLGVATWAAHSHATDAWDAFTRVRFRK